MMINTGDDTHFESIKITYMKKHNLFRLLLVVLSIFVLPHGMKAQDEKEKEKLLSESKNAKADIIKTDPTISSLFTSSQGYVIFPKNGKGGLIIGGSGGNGVLYEKGKSIGTAKMAQVTIGAQVGGASYREIIFFETKEALDRFKDNKLEFSGTVSAVALKSGASKNAKYADGVAVFTQDLTGLMAEATVGGQKFTYKPL
jgi:lipid-binding SYLF domain-containing protein